MYTCIHVYIHMCIYVHLSLSLYIYIYICHLARTKPSASTPPDSYRRVKHATLACAVAVVLCMISHLFDNQRPVV